MTNDASRTKMASIDRVAADAAELGLAIEIRTLNASTRTAEEAAAACGCDVAQIVKSLVFEDSGTGEIVLLLVSGRHNVDLDFLRSHHGLDLRRCDPRRVRDETGFAIGGVAPIGHLTKPSIWMDGVLDGFDVVYAAAGRPDSVFAVDPRHLRQAIGATPLNVNQKSAVSH